MECQVCYEEKENVFHCLNDLCTCQDYCQDCLMQNLLVNVSEPSCLACNVELSDEQFALIPRNWRCGEHKIYRGNVLFDREMSRLPLVLEKIQNLTRQRDLNAKFLPYIDQLNIKLEQYNDACRECAKTQRQIRLNNEGARYRYYSSKKTPQLRIELIQYKGKVEKYIEKFDIRLTELIDVVDEAQQHGFNFQESVDEFRGISEQMKENYANIENEEETQIQNNVRNIQSSQTKIVSKFTIPCGNHECQGMIDSDTNQCPLCNYTTCTDCLTQIDDHLMYERLSTSQKATLKQIHTKLIFKN